MARTDSPLRYPGGKSALLNLTVNILRANGLDRGHYAEPFAGGCGLALALLFEGYVAEIHVNDVDPSIWAFWYSVLNNADEFIAKIIETPVTMHEWYRQREIHRAQETSDSLELGYSAFFLNRTNRSGIIKTGGVIGGLDQSGNYKLDCRYNSEDLIRRIRRISRYRNQINLTNQDATEFLDNCTQLPNRSFLFIDPPYYRKGSGLYTSFFGPHDHAILADQVMRLDRNWVVTYDDVAEIRSLYSRHRKFSIDVSYTLQEKRIGRELLIASKGLRLTSAARDRFTLPPNALAA